VPKIQPNFMNRQLECDLNNQIKWEEQYLISERSIS